MTAVFTTEEEIQFKAGWHLTSIAAEFNAE